MRAAVLTNEPPSGISSCQGTRLQQLFPCLQLQEPVLLRLSSDLLWLSESFVGLAGLKRLVKEVVSASSTHIWSPEVRSVGRQRSSLTEQGNHRGTEQGLALGEDFQQENNDPGVHKWSRPREQRCITRANVNSQQGTLDTQFTQVGPFEAVIKCVS